MRMSDWSSDVCSSDLLKPVKRRGNRRYYQHHEVLLIRRIRDLLYEQGFTISGARNRLGDLHDVPHDQDAAVRLSGAELQALRSDLDSSEERRAGKECVSPCRSRWSPFH